jgi:hypothetical protein
MAALIDSATTLPRASCRGSFAVVNAVAPTTQTLHRLVFDLADTLAGDAQTSADFGEGVLMLGPDAIPHRDEADDE